MASGSGRQSSKADDKADDGATPVVVGSPIVDQEASKARVAAEESQGGPKRLKVLLAHALFQDEDTGRCIGVESARDPRTGEVPEGWVYRKPGDEIEVTVEVATTLIGSAYVQVDPYDTVAVDVLLASAK